MQFFAGTLHADYDDNRPDSAQDKNSQWLNAKRETRLLFWRLGVLVRAITLNVLGPGNLFSVAVTTGRGDGDSTIALAQEVGADY